MVKVYKALYRTDWIYAEGFIVFYDDKTVEGLFASDYMYIYEYNRNIVVFLKTLSFYRQNGLRMKEINLYEFFSHKQDLIPFNTYLFFNSSNFELSLEIKEEICDIEEIKIILMDLSKVRA